MAENEDADDLAIVFRSAGKPIRMSSAAKWRRAITLGDLTRETPVEVEASGRSLGVRPAGEVPALQRLFDEIAPHAEADAAPPAPEEAIPPSVAEPVGAVVAEAVAAPPPPPVPPHPTPTAPTPPAAARKTGPGGCLATLGVVLVVAFVVAKSCSHRHSAAPTAETQTVYVTRQVNLRPGPSSSDAPTGALDRGTALIGVWNDADKTWFKIAVGDHQGSYVWGMDLADRARPDLPTNVATSQATARAVTEYREADTTSPSERDVAAGETLVVAGKLASGWWEVLNKGKTASAVAGVGYVPPEAFDAPAPAAAEAAPAPTEAVAAGLSVSGCNQSGRPIAVAFAYLPRGGGVLWRYKGWTPLAPGECKVLFATNTADFYLRAVTNDDGALREWGGAVRRCVSYPGPYEYDLELGGTCPSGTSTALFFRRTPATAVGPYTETFD